MLLIKLIMPYVLHVRSTVPVYYVRNIAIPGSTYMYVGTGGFSYVCAIVIFIFVTVNDSMRLSLFQNQSVNLPKQKKALRLTSFNLPYTYTRLTGTHVFPLSLLIQSPIRLETSLTPPHSFQRGDWLSHWVEVNSPNFLAPSCNHITIIKSNHPVLQSTTFKVRNRKCTSTNVL